MRETVRPENLVNTIVSKTNKGNFTQFGHMCIWRTFVDMLVRFWGQKVKGQSYSRQ